MAKKPQQNIDSILATSQGLQNILQKSRLLEQLNQLLQPLLPQALQGHCQVANYRDNTLVLAIDNAIWVNQLRYAVPELLEQLRGTQMLAGLAAIKWIVTSAVDKYIL